jgi:hypothetical protein
MPPRPALQLDGLVAGYVAGRRRTAVCGRLNQTLYSGELACLIGPKWGREEHADAHDGRTAVAARGRGPFRR